METFGASHSEIGTFEFTYRTLGMHGVGISASSNFAVLYEALQQYLRYGAPLDYADVASRRSHSSDDLRLEQRLLLMMFILSPMVVSSPSELSRLLHVDLSSKRATLP
jgi:hypothetical protein